ncbi:hypothetical protein [Streptosporangium sp. NPDC006007]|uniref:hypothetical protein n=1 Tax=Streptosporangium sp. NPDC006007 TaxID=3154575 RepID=UPI0033AE6AEB
MSSAEPNDTPMPSGDDHPNRKLEKANKKSNINWEIRASKTTIISGIIGTIVVLVGLIVPLASGADPAPETLPPQSSPTSWPKCNDRSVCLWERQNFVGDPWKWTPGKDPDGPLPPNLRDHVGSFDSQVKFDEKTKRGVCFVDTTSGEKHPARERDYGSDYLSRFGSRVDVIQQQC